MPTRRREDHRLVRAGARHARHLAVGQPSRVAAGPRAADNRLLNLGNPAGAPWLIDHVDHLLTDQGIDLYRQDFNINPLRLSGAHTDAADRQGITEIRHVKAYLAYWDELRHRHPDMLIDSCASGGRRNDLETLRRAVPLSCAAIIFTVRRPCRTHLRTVPVGSVFWHRRARPGILMSRSQIMEAAMPTGPATTETWTSTGGRGPTAQWREVDQ